MENKGKVILKLSKIINSDFKILSQHFYNTVFLINIFYENSLIGKMIKILNNAVKSWAELNDKVHLLLETSLSRLGQVAVLSIAQKTRWKVKEKEETEEYASKKKENKIKIEKCLYQ